MSRKTFQSAVARDRFEIVAQFPPPVRILTIGTRNIDRRTFADHVFDLQHHDPRGRTREVAVRASTTLSVSSASAAQVAVRTQRAAQLRRSRRRALARPAARSRPSSRPSRWCSAMSSPSSHAASGGKSCVPVVASASSGYARAAETRRRHRARTAGCDRRGCCWPPSCRGSRPAPCRGLRRSRCTSRPCSRARRSRADRRTDRRCRRRRPARPPLRNPEQAHQRHRVIDAQRAGVAHVVGEQRGERGVARRARASRARAAASPSLDPCVLSRSGGAPTLAVVT